MFFYNVVIDRYDCYGCPWAFERLEDCLDSAYSELSSLKSHDCVAFIYLGNELIKKVEMHDENLYLVSDC